MGLFYEADKTFEELVREKKNFVFIGEAGSGKSEIVLNVAVMLVGIETERAAAEGREPRRVELFDMDQTKPLYRSRDMAEEFAARGIDIHYQDQYLDAPTLVGGVAVSLQSDNYTLLDIGGGQQAAKFAGSFNHLLSKDDSAPVYILNPYRPWTRDIESVDGTMSFILKSIRLDHIYLLANPNLGCFTTAEEALAGLDKLDELLEGITTVNSACVRREIADEVEKNLAGRDRNIVPIDLYLTYEFI